MIFCSSLQILYRSIFKSNSEPPKLMVSKSTPIFPQNDGMVGEKRYFECAAKHGLFAPLHKVTRSPKNRMMRERSSLTPGKLRR